MKKFLLAGTACLVLFASCAKYQAEPLDKQMGMYMGNTYTHHGVTVTVKAYNKADCMHYLGRDLLAQGFQPIQITVQNDTNRNMLISKDSISLSLSSDKAVASSVETSTVGRATGYGAASLIAWPFAIPAIVDGVKSSDANSQLDSDYAQKSIHQQTILPGTKYTGLVFTSKQFYNPNFSITIIDKDTRDVIKFDVTAERS